MSYRTDIAYRYDGSFNGLMCCVFESFYSKEMPLGIFSPEDEQETLFELREIEADAEKAERVIESIPRKISLEAKSLVYHAFLTCLPEKELHILRFLHLGYRVGGKVTQMLTEPRVDVLNKAVQHLANEAHLLCGFVRFSEYDGALLSVIEPKNCVLPLLADHFSGRFPEETFMIYDKTHSYALVHQNGSCEIIRVDNLEIPEADANEESYRALWENFYNSIAIEGRYNPKCRMTHMPKRYWAHMTEFQRNDEDKLGRITD